MQLSQILKNQHWQMAIDPNKLSNNWFLNPKNQRRFGGNGTFLFIIGIIICLLQRLFFIVLSLNQLTIAAIVFTAVIGIGQVKC